MREEVVDECGGRAAGLRGRGEGGQGGGQEGKQAGSCPRLSQEFRAEEEKDGERKKGEVSLIKHEAMQTCFLTHHQPRASRGVIHVSSPHFCRATIKKGSGKLNDVSNIVREGRSTSKLI